MWAFHATQGHGIVTHPIMAPPTAIDTNGYEDTTTSKVVPAPLTIAGVSARRAKAPKISGGIASYAGSEMFKGPVVWMPALPISSVRGDTRPVLTMTCG